MFKLIKSCFSEYNIVCCQFFAKHLVNNLISYIIMSDIILNLKHRSLSNKVGVKLIGSMSIDMKTGSTEYKGLSYIFIKHKKYKYKRYLLRNYRYRLKQRIKYLDRLVYF
jgi:hypothetical protein